MTLRHVTSLRRLLSASSTALATKPQQLLGSAPHHNIYVAINHDISPQVFPPKLMTTVQRELLLKINQTGAILSLAWSPQGTFDKNSAAVAFSPYGRLEIPELNVSNIEEVYPILLAHAQGKAIVSHKDTDKIFLYVCTHAARDCRCGEHGGAVVKALREELQRRFEERVRVFEVGHVGGHVFAANLLCYTSYGGDWLGNDVVRP